MECSSCGALIDAGDRFCPACCLPNMAGSHHPKFGPPEREPSPLFVDRVVGPGLRPCPRCADGIRASDHYCRSCGLDLADLAPLPPPGRTVGVWTTPGPEGDDWYRSTAVSSAAVRLVLGAVALVGACVVANSLLIYQALGGWIPILGSAGPHPNWADLQNWSGNLAALQLVLIALATVLVIAWTRRTYRNLPALNVIDLRLRPAWAMWGWLIPGVNLVLPKRVVDDTWRASDPTDAPYAPGESGWQRHPTPTIHHLWWICTLVALPLVVLTELQLSLAGSLPPATTAGIHDGPDGRAAAGLLAGPVAVRGGPADPDRGLDLRAPARPSRCHRTGVAGDPALASRFRTGRPAGFARGGHPAGHHVGVRARPRRRGHRPLLTRAGTPGPSGRGG